MERGKEKERRKDSMTRAQLEQERKQKVRVMKRNILKAFIRKYLKFLGFLAFVLLVNLFIRYLAIGAEEQQIKEAESWNNGTYVYPQ